MKDYYQILGVAKNAKEEDIKKAFRKLAHQYHPDKKGGDEARFKEVSEAYAVLSDKKKRAEYDAYGRTFSGGAQAGQGFGGFDFSNFQGFNGFQGDVDFGDIFSEFFGGGMHGGGRRGRDISIDIEISFRDSIFGTERRVLITKTGVCKECTGTGGKPGTEVSTCEKCGGAGQIRETRNSFLGALTTVRECPECFGRGNTPKEKCKTCKGHGIAKQEEEIKINIPAGIRDGEMIRMPGRGEAVSSGASGDLYVKVHVKSDPAFTREGNNIFTTLSVKLTDALLGSEYTVPTLDGDITLKVPAGVSHGEVLRVRGKGVPFSEKERGDLNVRIEIRLPQKLSRNVRKIIEDLKKEGL